jgi:hypothetical protein
VILFQSPNPLPTSKKGVRKVSDRCGKTRQRVFYGLGGSGWTHSAQNRPQAARSLRRYLMARERAACCTSTFRTALDVDRPAKQCQKLFASEAPDPGDIMSEYRATSSRNAWATSSESALKEGRLPNRRDREGEWGRGATVGVIAAMVIVMAVAAFTLHRNSPLVATPPAVNASEPSTTGQGALGPVRGRSGIDR